MPSFPRALTLILALTLTLSALGCAAKDKHVFVSTVNQPTTIALLDTYKSEAVWEMDIPVNHKLVLDFEGTTDGQSSDGVSPSWVNWELFRADDLPTDTGRARKGTPVGSDRVDLTGCNVLMKVTYRPAPETPGSVDAAPVPVQETTQSVAAEAIAESKDQADAAEVVEAVEPEAAATQPVEEAIEEATEEAAEEATNEVVEEAPEAVEEVPVEEVVEDAVDDAIDAAATQPTK